MISKARRFWLLAGLAALAACSHSSDDETDVAVDKKPLPLCPQVAISRELESMQDYGRETPAPDQLVASALMRSIKGTCEFEKTGIDIKFELSFGAERGPRLGGLHTTFPYFIAVLDPSENILNKEQMTLNVNFASDSPTTITSQTLHVFIPLPKAQRATAPGYQVLAGFQLTKEQLEAAGKSGR